MTTKAQTSSGNIVTITLGDDNYSGPFHGKQEFQVFIDPPIGNRLDTFKSVSLVFLRKPKRGGDWMPLRGFEVTMKGKQGSAKHLSAHGELSTFIRENSIEFQGEVYANIAGMWKMEVTLTQKESGNREQVSSENFIVR